MQWIEDVETTAVRIPRGVRYLADDKVHDKVFKMQYQREVKGKVMAIEQMKRL